MNSSIIRNRTQWLHKLSMALLATLPLLAWYKIPFPVGLGYALVLFLSVYTIARSRFKINVVPNTYWMVFTYVCFMWMYNHGFEIWTLFPPGGWDFFIFLLALLWGITTFDLVLLKKYMQWVVMISGILFWIQFVLVFETGSNPFCFVPNLTGAFTYEDFTYGDIVAKHMRGLPCSIFLEKSYLAYYFLTYLTLIWFEIDKEKKLFSKEIVFVIATLIASQSGTALVGLSILFTTKIFLMYWNTNSKRRIILIIFAVPLIIGVTYIYITTELGQQMLSRRFELFDEHTSGYSRIVGGYVMFEQLKLNEQFFGITDYRDRFGFLLNDGNFKFYCNGIQTILLSLGYIGTLLYLIFYINLFRNISLTSRMCVIILLVMGLLESNYLNPYMMLLTIIPCAEYYRCKTTNKRIQHPYI